MNTSMTLGTVLVLFVGFILVLAIAAKEWQRYERRKLILMRSSINKTPEQARSSQ